MKNKSAKGRVKLFSLLAVTMMVLMAFAVAMPADESDADSSSYYKYVINYTNEKINSVDVYTSSGGSATNISTSKNSIWNFGSDGYGPFNSCYAAVKKDTGVITYHLNPSDLSKTVEGSTYTMSDYNIVWLIPTVYWSVSGNSLILSSDSSQGTAYAHTIGGHVYKYIGIGVYEASTSTVGGNTCLMSQSGQTPAVSQNIGTFDNYAHNTPGTTMLWNFYQWTFTKMATYMVGMGKNTQQIWGAGASNNSAASTTGNMNTQGPYYGSSTESKVFIENSWGSVYEFVGDVVFNSRTIYAGQNSSVYAYDSTSGRTSLGVSLPSSNGWITATSKNAATWDLPTSSSSSSNATDTNYPGDRVYSYSGVRVLNVGGYWYDDTYAGVAYASASNVSTNTSSYLGARLAYVFDADPAASSPANYDLGTLPSNLQSQVTVTKTTGNISGGSVATHDLGNVGGYEHVGWKYGTSTYCVPGGTMTGISGTSATLTALWCAPITLNNAGASNGSTTISATSDSTYSNCKVTLPSYNNTNLWAHTGWTKDGSSYSKGQTVTITYSASNTFTSTWNPTVNFDHSALSAKGISTAGLSTTPVAVNSGASYILSQLSAVSGYTHVGWIIPGVNNNTVQAVNYTLTNITAPITVSSYWLEPMITITFVYTPQNVVNSTTHTLGTLQVPQGSIGILFTPDLDDMYDATFEGWYDDATLTTAHDIYETLDDDVTLYAKATAHLAFTSSPTANATITRLDSYSSIFAFSAVGSNAAYKITWDFGDGSDNEHGVYAYHEFNDDKKHIVTLTVENLNGEKSTIQKEVFGTGYSEENQPATEPQQESKSDNTMIYIAIGVVLAAIAGFFVLRRL